MSKVPIFASASIVSSIVELYINQRVITNSGRSIEVWRNVAPFNFLGANMVRMQQSATVVNGDSRHLSFNASRFGHYWVLYQSMQINARMKIQGETLEDGGVSWWRAAAVTEMGSAVGSGRVSVSEAWHTPVVLGNNYCHHNILEIILLLISI